MRHSTLHIWRFNISMVYFLVENSNIRITVLFILWKRVTRCIANFVKFNLMSRNDLKTFRPVQCARPAPQDGARRRRRRSTSALSLSSKKFRQSSNRLCVFESTDFHSLEAFTRTPYSRFMTVLSHSYPICRIQITSNPPERTIEVFPSPDCDVLVFSLHRGARSSRIKFYGNVFLSWNLK